MILSSSLKTLNITLSICPGWSVIHRDTVSTAISAALLLGKRNTPVEIQQKAMVFLYPICSRLAFLKPAPNLVPPGLYIFIFHTRSTLPQPVPCSRPEPPQPG